jgi:hypothetical protein
MNLLKSSQATKLDKKRKSLNSNNYTEVSCTNISYRSSESVPRKNIGSRSMSKQRIEKSTSRSSS